MDKVTEFERFIETLEAMECPYEKALDGIQVMGIEFWFDNKGRFVKAEDCVFQKTEWRGVGYS